jgi:L-rhamnose mutarotase
MCALFVHRLYRQTLNKRPQINLCKSVQSVAKNILMNRIAFKMQLHPGKSEEYKRRHDNIWPELSQLLSKTGIQEYSIFLDEETLSLFAVLKIEDPSRLDLLPDHPIMQKWWAYMGDIMDTHPDHSPVSKPLKEVFYLLKK